MVEVGDFLLRVLEQQGSGVLLLFIFLFGIWKFKDDIKELFKSIVNYRQKVKEGQKARQDADLKMQIILNEVREELSADKAAVFEFHNGGHNATGLPFRHLSLSVMLNEVGCDEDVMAFNGIPTSSISKFIRNLQKEPFCYFETIEDLKGLFPSLYYKLRADGIVEALFAPINGVDDDKIGIIMFAITNHHPKEMERKEIESILIPRLQQLSTLLDLKNHQ